ncbi:hypothetical protein [Candidatus Methylobacter oryzae]|nr:hypothetical protein [Candidatus Methylobacter oryzae]
MKKNDYSAIFTRIFQEYGSIADIELIRQIYYKNKVAKLTQSATAAFVVI